MPDVLFVQGAGAGVHADWDRRLVESLRRALGPRYDVRYPPMPNEADPEPGTWGPVLERELALLRPGGIVVGHSVGGTLALQVLADAPASASLGAIALIAAPYIGPGGWEFEQMESAASLAARLPPHVPVFLYHGEADTIIPVAHVERYAEVLPRARVRRLAGRDHQLGDDLSEVASDIRTCERSSMSTVFVNIGLSLDGYLAPEGMTMSDPDHMNWGAKWGALMGWILATQYFRENHGFGPGGETGPVNDLVRGTMERTGANIMGKRMFDQGEVAWPEEAPFHTPVYVLTHEKRDPWVRPGGTTFYFVNDGPERALALAREAAGGRDVRISGGADVIQQYLNLGVVDELEIALAPVLFHGGRRLFENLREPGPQFRIDRVLDGPAATHLRYVRR